MSYQWYKNGSPIAGATSSSYTILSVLGSDAGTYYVKVTNAGGSVNSDTATLNLNLPPTITTQPVSQTITQGQNASFSVAVTGSGPFTYQWRFNGSPLSGATAATLSLTNVQSAQAGNYRVVVADSAGSVTSSVATLTVYVPAGITTQPQSQTLVQGQNLSLSVVASGTSPFSYRWYHNGSSMGGNSATQTVSSVSSGDAGNYFVTVANVAGNVTSAVAVVTVVVPPSIQSQTWNQTVNQGQSAAFSVTAGGSAPLIYQWNFNGSPLAGATNPSLALTNVQGSQAGSYNAVVSNAGGSATSQVATLTVIVPPTITTQPQSQALVQGQSLTLSVAASGTSPFTYRWYFNGARKGGNSATLTVNGVDPSDAGSWVVTVANSAGMVTSAVAVVTVYVPAGIATQPQSQVVLPGQDASFTVVPSGTPPFDYQWYFNGASVGPDGPTLVVSGTQPTDIGSYSVVVLNGWGSVTSTVATLSFAVPPGIVTQPQDEVVAPGQVASFSVTASGTAPLSYQWNLNGAALPGATNSTLTITNAQVTDAAGGYSVVVTNMAGSVTSAVAMLTVAVAPGILAQPLDQTVAPAQIAVFSVTASGTAPLSYQWNLNGAPLPGATSSALTLTNPQLTDAGGYSVVVTNIAGSVTSSVARLTVTNPTPITGPVLDSAIMTPAGFSFQAAVPVGHTYIVFATPDLQTWTPIATNVANTATITFTDPAATNAPMQFYRILVQ